MTISVVIPVYREAAVINDTLTRLEGMARHNQVEIIVVDGSAEGETLAAIRSGRVKGMISARGRGKQMNAGAAAARGEVILFLHADTLLPEGALGDISRVMETGRFAGGAFDLGIGEKGFPYRLIERVASLRSRLTRIPYGDQAIFVKHSFFTALGGYRDFPIMEDVDLMRRVKRRGGKICFIARRVHTSARRWKKEGILRCTVRNWAIMLLYLLGVSPKTLARWYS